MATFKVKVLYDFSGEPNTAEMSVTAGEILTVTRTDVGEGWWEGLNSQGVSGLFPEAYVEKMSSGPPAMPAPVLPPVLPPEPAWPNQVAANQYANQDNEDWDDDWDNDDTYSEIPNNGATQQRYEPNHNVVQKPQDVDTISQDFGPDNKGTVSKKSFNRFSTFVKSGGESYIMGNLKVNANPSAKIRIMKVDENNFSWPIISNPYTVQVTSPVKETKLGGLKTFVAYQLTPSYSGETVNRRYKQFDWLHERLTEKFNLIAIPPLPDKQIKFDKFEQDFVDRRRVLLQEFVDYVCRHPVLSTCDVWHHFLTRSDKVMWKKGKREAEKDPLVGANFCLCIEAPEKDLLQNWVDERMEKSSTFIHSLDQALKSLMSTAMDQMKKCQGVYKREYSRIGESFYTLGTAIESEEKAVPSELATGKFYFILCFHRYLKRKYKNLFTKNFFTIVNNTKNIKIYPCLCYGYKYTVVILQASCY